MFSAKTVTALLAISGALIAWPALAQLQSPYQGQAYQNQASMNAAQSGPESVLLLLDSSQSMAEPLSQGETKMAVAKRTILDVLQRIPAGTPVGLRVYGNSANSFTACNASTNLVPIGTNNRLQIASQMIGVKPTGATPITHAVKKALEEDFASIPGRKSIILVSDGLETCSTDPCDLAVQLVRSGVEVKINVVGYGMQDMDDAAKQLKCVAMATRGRFVTANTSAELAQALDKLTGARTNVQAQILPTPAPPPQR